MKQGQGLVFTQNKTSITISFFKPIKTTFMNVLLLPKSIALIVKDEHAISKTLELFQEIYKGS